MNITIPGTVMGSVIGQPLPVQGSTPTLPQGFQSEPPPQSKIPEQDLPRANNYYADYSGCGFWRMIWPEHVLCAYQKMIITGSTCMVHEPGYYKDIKSIRLQRQASPNQLQFLKFLRKAADQQGFRLIYEIDDIMFREDIPEYNRFKFAFDPDDVRKASQEMISMCDEVSVTCNFMRDYYKSKTGNNNITVIPNYPPRFWLGNIFDESLLLKNYDKCMKKRKKPRVLYAGSGAHFDVGNKVGGDDDFGHVVDTIAKTVNKIDWVFLGAFPMQLRPLVQSGKIEFHPWAKLYDYPAALKRLKVNCMVAPLKDNIFNKSKSDIKYVEACSLGVPIACQDLVTYEKAPYKFTTADEMIDQVNFFMSDKQQYMKMCRKANQHAQTRWLENPDNINKYYELYNYAYDSSDRKLLNR